MQKIEQLRKRIRNAEELKSIVRTMKVTASVGIHQFEEAVVSLSDYYDTLELGLQVVLSKQFSEARPFLSAGQEALSGYVVIGSGQSLCGPFDETMANYVCDKVKREQRGKARFFVLGERISSYLQHEKLFIDNRFELPVSAIGISALVLKLLDGIEDWQEGWDIRSIYILHNKPLETEGYRPHIRQLLPLNRSWLERLVDKPWATNNLPQFTVGAHILFLSLVRQYLFVLLFRAIAESLAAEYKSRLLAMQQAEQKIEEQLDKLSKAYTSGRQAAITEELMDIIAGFEAIKEDI